MARWLIGGALVVLCSGTALAADNPPSVERQERTPAQPAQKDAPAAEPKKKSDPELKSPETPPKSPSEDKSIKAEPPPVPAQKQEQKQEDSVGKKPVTSLNLTIKLALMADPALFPFEIEVEMDNQKAVLTGAVSTEEEKAKAGEVVRMIEGVEAVVNKLSVSPALRSALTKRQDDAIAHIVKERLNKSETLKAVGFDVKSDNGVVVLSGKTRFQVIALEAAEAARQIPGVRAVNTAAVQITGKD